MKPKYGTLDFHVRVKVMKWQTDDKILTWNPCQETEAKPDTPVVAVVVKGDVDGSVEVTLIVSRIILINPHFLFVLVLFVL